MVESTELRSYPLRNLVQGVSQQTAQQRRDTQNEEQFDCVNSPINGCEARPPMALIGMLLGVQGYDAFCYDIFRGDLEHYLVVITKSPDANGHYLKVYDWLTGLPCYVHYVASESYLVAGDLPKDAFTATTLEDVTLIANRDIRMVMDQENLSPANQNAAIIYFKAGGYSIKFRCTVQYAGVNYTFDYETPDNSTSANAAYIGTNQLAYTFANGFTGGAGAVLGTGAGQVTGTHGTVIGTPTSLTSLGFTVELNGSCIRLSRADTNVFRVDCSDGVGDTYMIAIKNTAKHFDDLPASCFDGFTTKVIGTNKKTEDDYYVQYTADLDGSAGYWKEVVAPATPLTFDPDTMPHGLINTGVGTFEWGAIDWGNRVSGDGLDTALDPSFVGKFPEDLFYDNGRLGILWEGAGVWSRSKNPYVFFPDTAQTTLDTDPIDITVGGGKRIAILRRVIQINEATYLWAQKLQFRIDSGQNAFKADTVQSKLSTTYEFSSLAPPAVVGDSLYFVSEPGPWAAVRNLSTDGNGKVAGTASVTDHVRKYVPANVRILMASDTLGILIVFSEDAPDRLFFYNYLITDTARAQSAWNTWRLPAGCTVLHGVISNNYIYLLIQRDEGMAMLRVNMAVDLKDPQPADAKYLTRVDLRVHEYFIGFQYNPVTDTTLLQLPFEVSAAEGSGFTDDDAGTNIATCPLYVVNRIASETYLRGRAWHVLSITGAAVTVRGDCSLEGIYVGYKISAEMELSKFYLKDAIGVVAAKKLTIKDFEVLYASTGYFRVTVAQDFKDTRTKVFTGRTFGDINNAVGELPITEGAFHVPVDGDSFATTIRLINDSFLPSRWTSAKYDYLASFHSKPTAGQGKAGGA